MVFVMVFIGLAKGEYSSTTGAVFDFFRMSIGGPIWGFIIGFLVSYWLKRIIRDTTLSVAITFMGSYLCFFIAEFTWLHVGGILSIVTLGLYFSAVGKKSIYPESEQALQNVWTGIQYMSETVLFTLNGVLVGVLMLKNNSITTDDWIKMLIFWVLLFITRTIMVATVYPLIRKFGTELTSK